MPEETDRRITRLEQQMETAVESLEKLDHAINGNGKPGIKSDVQVIRVDMKQMKQTLGVITGEHGLLVRMSQLENSVSDHHKSVDELRKRDRSNWQWVVTVAVAIASVLVAFFK